MTHIRHKGHRESSARGRGRTARYTSIPECPDCNMEAIKMRINGGCVYKCFGCKKETKSCRTFDIAKEAWGELFNG